MGGGFEDNLLDDQVRGAIHDFALEARHILMDEARDLLEGVYGVHSNGHFDPPENLPALAIPENRELYERLIRFLDDEVQAGLARPKAVEKLRKEIAFTHLNRLVAFKMMERRKLIREAVGRGIKSNGFLFYLADHPEDEALWQAGQSEVAYQHFLLWQAGQIAQEIEVLFDPDSLPSRLSPRVQAIQIILELINSPMIAPAWETVEVIGWVYQYFNEPELQATFSAVSTGAKFEAEDIPSVTQLFTIRWIVRYLVENTLGTLWLEMHPDSVLKEKLRYLVSNPEEGQGTENGVGIKPVKQITLLDPACGTMHFGVLAFDLFTEMYREEIQRAGEPGWPETPSVETEAEIPTAILANNLYGIDIDLRAVQLAALSLYLKVKNLNKYATITRHNLACANVLTLNGKRLGVFLKEAQFSRPIYERLIRALWEKLENINQLGSLLRLEQEVETLIANERARYEREGRQSDMFVDRSAEFESAAAKEEYWAILGGQIIQAIDHFAKAQAEAGSDQSFFTGEAIKGMQVLGLMLREYDVVVTNPPYMSRRKMNNTLAKLLDKHYKEGKGDLYAAFIMRCLEFAGDMGYVGMLTMHSFMFISSFKNLRTHIREQSVIESMVHLGPGLFATGNPGTLQTTAFILRHEQNPTQRHNHIGTYFRLVHEPDAEAKQLTFEKMVATLQHGEIQPGVYQVAQRRFDTISGNPWVYWVSEKLRDIFQDLPKVGDYLRAIHGTATYDNFRFLRFWWEIGKDNTALYKTSWIEFLESGAEYVPYMKGGTPISWYGNQNYVLKLTKKGRTLIEFLSSKRDKIRGEEFIFKEGVTWSDLSTVNFAVRYLPPGFIFDVKGSSGFTMKQHLLHMMRVMNSSWMKYAIELLNPTISFQVGDISRIPVNLPSREQEEQLDAWTQAAVRNRMLESKRDELTFEFIAPWSAGHGLSQFEDLHCRLIDVEARINDEVYRLYSISDFDRATIETELRGQLITTGDEKPTSQEKETGEDKFEIPLTRQELAVRWVSWAVGVVMGRFVPCLFPADGGDRRGGLGCAVYRREDFAIGSLPAPNEAEFNELVGLPEQFAYIDENDGRHVFSVEVEQALRDLAIQDGIAILDKGHPSDLPTLVEKALVLILGESNARDVIREATGDSSSASLHKFLERDFFTKWHMKWYKKRPVYWPIQSPNRGYGFVIFHEKITKDTFFAIQRKPFLESKINAVTFHLEEIEDLLHSAQGAKRKSLEKQLDQTRKLADELAEFSQTLERITVGSDDLPGYTPEDNWFDDGVILRMAPLWEVIPIWKSEPKKYWERLQNGDYDWSHIAMHYWPERCKEKCKTNKSYAIAHGHEELYEGD